LAGFFYSKMPFSEIAQRAQLVQYVAGGNENVSSIEKKPMSIAAYIIFATKKGLQF
jgi:hypothetical protein